MGSLHLFDQSANPALVVLFVEKCFLQVAEMLWGGDTQGAHTQPL